MCKEPKTVFNVMPNVDFWVWENYHILYVLLRPFQAFSNET